MTRYLNIGCGHRRHPAWVNLDMRRSTSDVIVHNLRTPLPFPDQSFDVVYHSHTLEHLEQDQGRRLLEDCYRILKPGGMLRVVVPDLEQIARRYLDALSEADRIGSPEAAANHEWMLIEMTDQLARQRADGEATRFIARPDIVNAEFVASRWGSEGRGLLADHAALRRNPASRPTMWSRFLLLARHVGKYPLYLREILLRLLLGAAYPVWELGRYRLSGDVHLWMYDRVSLARLLTQCGFDEIMVRGAADSAISGWSGFNLDTEPDGSVYRPNSLFMEGRRSPLHGASA